MIDIRVLIRVTINEKETRLLHRDVQLPVLPRVGDYLCAHRWGLGFSAEGAVVESVGISLDDAPMWVWVADDTDSWRDMAVWGTEKNMLDQCYCEFNED